MSGTPSESSARKIHSLIQELAAKRGLDDTKSAELFDQLAKRQADYLRGRIGITADDALLLAWRHLGGNEIAARQLTMAGEPRAGQARSPRTAQTAFTVSVLLLGVVFGLILPTLAYLSGSLRDVFQAEWPLVPLFLVRVSPWGMFAVAIAGVAALFAIERFCKARTALRVNIAAIAGVAVLGGAMCFVLLLPVIQIMHAIPD